MLRKPEDLPSEAFEPVSKVCFSAFFTYGDAKPRPTFGIRGHVKTHKPFTTKEFMSHHPAKIRLAAQPL